MDQREFNRQMSAYLRDRKDSRGGILSKLKRGLPTVEVVEDEPEQKPSEIPKEHVEAVMRGERVEHHSSMQEVMEEEMAPAKGWFRSWLDSLFPSREEDAEEFQEFEQPPVVQDKPAVEGDVKEMLRTCVHWVNRLPPEEIQEIRRSDEYREFKRLLDKYGLLKK